MKRYPGKKLTRSGDLWKIKFEGDDNRRETVRMREDIQNRGLMTYGNLSSLPLPP